MTHGPRLYPGAAAFVNEANNCMANVLLSQPGSGRLGLLQAGQVVEVLSGPFDVAGIRYSAPSCKRLATPPKDSLRPATIG